MGWDGGEFSDTFVFIYVCMWVRACVYKYVFNVDPRKSSHCLLAIANGDPDKQ